MAKRAKAWARRNWDHVGPIRHGAGPQTAPPQHVRDRRGGDRDAEVEQLALDPELAPPGVLPAHPKDQLAHRLIDRRTPWPATVRALPVQELPAPPVERVGHDRKGGPALSG